MSRLVSFRLFGVPVTIQPSFLIIAVLLGWSAGFGSWEVVVALVAIVVVSILIHELGHALVARSFGAGVEIELNGLGGLTRWGVTGGQLPPGKRALVAASGSATGLVFGGLVWLVALTAGPFAGTAGLVVRYLIYVNVFWGLLNWLPIRPLDGGHLLSALLSKSMPDRAERVAKVIFTLTAALALVVAIRFRLIFVGILAAWMLMGEFGAGQRTAPPMRMPTLSYDQEPGEEPWGPVSPAMGPSDPEPDERETDH